MLSMRSEAAPGSRSMASPSSSVSVARRFVQSLCGRILADSELSSQLALATHELLDNAVKYGVDDEPSLRVSVSNTTVAIRTRNRATAENIRRARRSITRVNAAQDPFRFYQELMMRSVLAPAGSGLGLARIRAETELTIDCAVDGDALEVVAQARIRRGGGP